MLKKLRYGNEEEEAVFAEVIETANAAKELAKTIFGNKTFMTNQTMLTYAMTLTKAKSRGDESREWFQKAEVLFDEINDNITFKEGCNLLFNMLLHYNFMVNDFGSSLDTDKRQQLIAKLHAQIQTGNKSQILLKKALVCIQETFIESDPSVCLRNLESILKQVGSTSSKLPASCSIKIWLKYFIANLSLRLGDMEKAARFSLEILTMDIPEYYGHSQSELTIEPTLIVLNKKFDELMNLLNERPGGSSRDLTESLTAEVQ